MSPWKAGTNVRGGSARPLPEITRDFPTTADPAGAGGAPEDLR